MSGDRTVVPKGVDVIGGFIAKDGTCIKVKL